MRLTRCARAVAASSNSPLGAAPPGAASWHRPQAVHAPTIEDQHVGLAAQCPARAGRDSRSAICRVSASGRNAGGVGRLAAELSGRAG